MFVWVKRAPVRLLFLASLLVPAALLASSCGSDGQDEAHAYTVQVTLREWYAAVGGVNLVEGPARVTFNVYNGGERPHELIVVDVSGLDFDADELPTKNDGSADLSADGIEVIGETREIDAGTGKTMVYRLAVGSYVLMCNLVEDKDGQKESHYQRGIRAPFGVWDPSEFHPSEWLRAGAPLGASSGSLTGNGVAHE